MTLSTSSRQGMNGQYWHARADDTKRQLSRVEGLELRTIYSELLVHYQRMARLYDAKPHPLIKKCDK